MAKRDGTTENSRAPKAPESEPEAEIVCGSREEALDRILKKVEDQLVGGEFKATVADYLRLIQLRKEMVDERPREIEITWVNSLAGEDSSDE